MSTPLTYQTVVYAAGQMFACIENYEAIYRRLSDVGMKMDEENHKMDWLPPIELTVRGEHGPLRALIQPAAIAAVVEMDERDRQEVPE